jgi:hypothetical protein
MHDIAKDLVATVPRLVTFEPASRGPVDYLLMTLTVPPND